MAFFLERLPSCTIAVKVRSVRPQSVERAGDVRIFEATEITGEASLDVYHDAQDWVAGSTE